MKKKNIMILLIILFLAGCNTNRKTEPTPIPFNEVVIGNDEEKVHCSVNNLIVTCSRTLKIDELGEITTNLKLRIKKDYKTKSFKMVILNAYVDLDVEINSQQSSISAEGYSNESSNELLNVNVTNEIAKDNIIYKLEESFQFSKNQLAEDYFSPLVVSRLFIEPVATYEEIMQDLQKRANEEFELLFEEYAKDYTQFNNNEYLNLPLFKERAEFIYKSTDRCSEGNHNVATTGWHSCDIINNEVTEKMYELNNFKVENMKLMSSSSPFMHEGIYDEVDAEILMNQINNNEWISIPVYFGIGIFDQEVSADELESNYEGYCYALSSQVQRCYGFEAFGEWNETYLYIFDTYTLQDGSYYTRSYQHLYFGYMKK